MKDFDLPPAVRSLIATCIGSLEQLEVLLWIHGHKEADWTAVEISDQLRTNPYSARVRLENLEAKGLIARGTRPDAWRWQPTRPEMDAAVALLRRSYEEKRYTVIEMVFASPPDPLRELADAFRIGKDT